MQRTPTIPPVWRRVFVLAAVAAAFATCAAGASAGSYRVYSCVAPSGGPAPVADGSFGWQASGRPQAGSLFLTNECHAGHGLTARLDGANAQPLGAGGQWTFTPAPNTSIAGFDLTWSGAAAGGGESTISRSDQADPTYERRYSAPFPTERVVENNVDLSYLLVLVACSFAQPSCSNPGGNVASYRIAESTMTLRDNSAPTATGVGGDLIANPQWRGPMSLSFSASDTGSGVYPRGKLVELQATDRGRWRTLGLVRSSRSGGFRYRYRFAGSGRFAFRARVRFERAYPYVLGYSRRTSVTVG
jgi:hypothetical protein